MTTGTKFTALEFPEVYTIGLITDTTVNVFWDHDGGGNVNYPLSEANEYMKRGDWKEVKQ